jgi:3-oxoacyl-[acyl-carrier protein] reductase
VIVHYGRGADEAETVVGQIRKAGGRAEMVGADLSAPDGAHMLAAKVRGLVGDRLDILLANAGIAKGGTIEATNVKEFDELFAVNVRAPFFLVQQLLPVLGDGSSVIFVSSLAARAAVPGLSAYSATKGAIDTMVKHFAAELGARGIRVNAVAPGVIDTEMSSFAKTEAGKSFVLGMQAMQRIGHPDDLADVFAYLASDGARWITGQTIHVDGGSKL